MSNQKTYMIIGNSVLDDGTVPVYRYKKRYEFLENEIADAKQFVVQENPHVRLRVVRSEETFIGEVQVRDIAS